MPELPEVETVARQLAPLVTGREVRALGILDPLLRAAPAPPLAGRRVETVRRIGKQVGIGFSATASRSRPVWLAVHLRMTGRLIWVPSGARPRRDHLRARFALDGGALWFVDTRRFGTFRWSEDPAAFEPAGLDPLAPAFTARRLAGLLDGATQNVKSWLLRQDRLVGLGNIYASEILHAAGVSPLRAAGSLDADEVRRVHRATRRILRRAIESCGTTFSDFQGAQGVTGSYQAYLRVYDRDAEPCSRCRAGAVRRIVQQQRSTFYCPSCQH